MQEEEEQVFWSISVEGWIGIVTTKSSQHSQECKDLCRQCFFCDSLPDLWPFDPNINRFRRLIVEHYICLPSLMILACS